MVSRSRLRSPEVQGSSNSRSLATTFASCIVENCTSKAISFKLPTDDRTLDSGEENGALEVSIFECVLLIRLQASGRKYGDSSSKFSFIEGARKSRKISEMLTKTVVLRENIDEGEPTFDHFVIVESETPSELSQGAILVKVSRLRHLN